MKPPPEVNKCIAAQDVSNGLVALLVGRSMRDCKYVKNSDKDVALDIELKCASSDETGKVTVKGMIAAKKFHLDYAAAFDGTGKETGRQERMGYVVAGEWQSATCRQ